MQSERLFLASMPSLAMFHSMFDRDDLPDEGEGLPQVLAERPYLRNILTDLHDRFRTGRYDAGKPAVM